MSGVTYKPLTRVGKDGVTFNVEISVLQMSGWTELPWEVVCSVKRGRQKAADLPALIFQPQEADHSKKQLAIFAANAIQSESKFYIKDGIPESKWTQIKLLISGVGASKKVKSVLASTLDIDLTKHFGDSFNEVTYPLRPSVDAMRATFRSDSLKVRVKITAKNAADEGFLKSCCRWRQMEGDKEVVIGRNMHHSVQSQQNL